jgi:hypothetical protein
MIRLTPLRRFAVHAIGLGIFASGVLWLVFHYFMRTEGPFGPQPDPGEQWARIGHGGFAFAALWVTGMLWERHITKAWGTARRRASGVLLFVILLALIVSGFLLYYVGDEVPLAKLAKFHWMLGLIAPLAFLQHRLARKRNPEPACADAPAPGISASTSIGTFSSQADAG